LGVERVLVVFVAVFVTDGGIMTAKMFPAKAALVIANPKSKLLDQLREVLRLKHYSLRTEEAYVAWVKRYLRFHRRDLATEAQRRGGEGVLGATPKTAGGTPALPRFKWIHPRDLGAADVVAFLNHLANVECVSAGTQNQALNAISFLYSQVLRIELGDLGEFLAASRRRRVPVVLSRVNRFAPRGLTTNRFAPRGLTTNRFAPRGLTTNRFAPRGLTTNRFAPRGFFNR
jgi:hypothetical protein